MFFVAILDQIQRVIKCVCVISDTVSTLILHFEFHNTGSSTLTNYCRDARPHHIVQMFPLLCPASTLFQYMKKKKR